MASNSSKQVGPLQDLFTDIQKIIEFMELKDLKAAEAAETSESKASAEMWLRANYKKDSYSTYKNYWTIAMFKQIDNNAKYNDIKVWMADPTRIPASYRDVLLEKGRQIFLDSYEEKNDYYRKLNGLPPIETPESEFIYLSDELREKLHAPNEPIHKLSSLIQNRYMSTEEYQKVLLDNPDKEYLKYLGLYKIDILTARNAKDFEIIRYPLDRSDINPHLINIFSSLYADYREYVMVTLYNKQFEDLYENYRNFMGVLILSFTLLQISNKGIEGINNKNFLDDSVLHTILSMYGIPNDLLLPNEIRRDLVININKLIQDKGTSNVYYDIVDILGYENINISKLLLIKDQNFDEENDYATSSENIKDPYFLQVDLKDQNIYDTITTGNAPLNDYKKITDSDSTWWDLPDTREILKNSKYNIADSKYITIEAVIPQIKYLFESIYFAKMIIDNRTYTDTFMIELPEIFGNESVSLYDIMIFIIAAMCMNNNLTGEFVTEEGLLKAAAGFNFDLNFVLFEEYLDNSDYVDKDKIRDFMKNLTLRTPADINRLYNEIMQPMREWLENKITSATIRKEYIEYENIYKALFTYDATKNSFLDEFQTPMEIIMEKYGISEEEILMYKCFYPRTMTGESIKYDEFRSSKFYPFLNNTNNIDWNIHIMYDTIDGIEDRGYLYFNDILNCDDVRLLTNPDGTRIFMDFEDDSIGWQINKQAVDRAIELIDKLDETDLKDAAFKFDTTVPNTKGKTFFRNTKLPASIRSGLYKNILKEKILMDCEGLANPPQTYQEFLYRKNEKLYNLLVGDNRFELDKQAWLNDVMKIILVVENELDLHLKYFEQSVLGTELFFKPLITLIKRFKSTFVNIAKTSLRYTFADKIDNGGNSNMLRLFDEVNFVIHFVILASNGYSSQLGLFDAMHSTRRHIYLNDRSEVLRMKGNEFDVNLRTTNMGSVRLVDEMKFFKNGKQIDPDGDKSKWFVGENNIGR